MADLVLKERSEGSLRDVCYILFRHKRKVTWFFLSVFLTVVLVTFLMPEIYQSDAKLLVRLGRESVTLDPTATTSGQIITVNTRRESEIKSELEILNSRDLAEKVVDAIGPEAFVDGKIYRFTSFIKSFFVRPDPVKERDSAVLNLMKHWTITSEKDSNIISLTYEGTSPKIAHDVLSQLIDSYLEKHLAVNRTVGSYDFFQEQTNKLRSSLTQAEKSLEELRSKTGVASVAEQRRILLERLGFLQKEKEQTDNELRASRDKGKAMQQMVGKMPATLVTGKTAGTVNYAADGMRRDLYKLQLKEQELLSKYTEKNFFVKEIRRQINKAEALLKKEPSTRTQVTTAINPTYQQLKLDLAAETAKYAALQAKAQCLDGHLASAQKDVKTLIANEVQIAQLQREKEIQEANYRKYSEKMEQARIDNALEMGKISNISVAQAATFPILPSRPKKALNLAMGVIFGAFGALGLACVTEYGDHSFKRPEDVEKKLHMPVLATIPLLAENGVALVDKARKDLPLLMPENPVSCGLMGEAWESYEALGDWLLGSEAPPHLIGVTSCHGNEGVSTVAANIAKTLARKSNARILLVEANLMRPTAHQVFGVGHTPGLTDVVLEGPGNFTSNNAYARNLDVIPSGLGGISLSQLADSKEFADLLTLWRNEYSSVIFDLPAIFSTNSTLRLASLLEGVFMVVAAEDVNWEVAQRAKAKLIQAKVNLLGVVLNKRCFHIPDWLYHKL
jgi:uncharacterized protein involved in exopolysaccharide biosynthesis/Mrp family chromosome partitioning ATPase